MRLARAFARSGVRLALLDEPFCGLDRDARRALLAEARRRWSGATLLCVTHDVGDTLGFERVLVVEAGRVVESGPPLELAAREGSAYRRLLDAEDLARQEIWDAPGWTRWRVERGGISAAGPESEKRPERAEDRA